MATITAKRSKPRKQDPLPTMGTPVFYYENGEAIPSVILHAHTPHSVDLVTVMAEQSAITPTGPLQGLYYIRREVPFGPNGWGYKEKIPSALGRKPRAVKWPSR